MGWPTLMSACGLERRSEVYVYAVVDDLRVVVEAEHLVAVDRYDDVRIPREVGTLYRHEVKRDIYAAVAHLADVGVGGLDLVAHVRGASTPATADPSCPSGRDLPRAICGCLSCRSLHPGCTAPMPSHLRLALEMFEGMYDELAPGKGESIVCIVDPYLYVPMLSLPTRP